MFQYCLIDADDRTDSQADGVSPLTLLWPYPDMHDWTWLKIYGRVLEVEPSTKAFQTAMQDIFSFIVELKRKHRFHPTCVINYWDGPHRYINRCPLCRQPAGALKDLTPGAHCAVTDVDYQQNSTPEEVGLPNLVLHVHAAFRDVKDAIITQGNREKSLTAFTEEAADRYFKPLIQKCLYEFRDVRDSERQERHPLTLESNYGL